MSNHEIAWHTRNEDNPNEIIGSVAGHLVSVFWSHIHQSVVIRFTEGGTFEQSVIPTSLDSIEEATYEAQALVYEAVGDKGMVWVNVNQLVPDAGDYHCKVINGERKYEAQRRLIKAGDSHQWFGGCRPFADNEVITHFKVVALFNHNSTKSKPNEE